MRKDKHLVNIAMFAAIIAAMGLIPRIDLPLAGGIPITAQSMGIMLAGVMLGARNGFLSVLLFLFVLALGAPLLSGGRGGIGVFSSPTVGFLVGFPVAAFVTGIMMRPFPKAGIFPRALLSSIVGGITVLYLFGGTGMMMMTKLDLAATLKILIVFIPGDILKAILVAAIAKTVQKSLPDYFTKSKK